MKTTFILMTSAVKNEKSSVGVSRDEAESAGSRVSATSTILDEQARIHSLMRGLKDIQTILRS